MNRQSYKDNPNVRLSFSDAHSSDPPNPYWSIFRLGLTCNGSQQAKIQIMHNELVSKQKWLSQTQFKQITNLCWGLPGPTVIQVIITTVTLRFRSLLKGIAAWGIYNLPTWILLTVFGLVSHLYLQQPEYEQDRSLKLLYMGFSASTAGIMMHPFLRFLKQHYRSVPKLLLIASTMVLFVLFPNPTTTIFTLILGSIISLYLQIEEPRSKMSNKSIQIFSNLSNHFMLGKKSIYLLLVVFFGLWLYFSIIVDSAFAYVFGFYFVGCFIVGPIDVVFAYFMGIIMGQGSLGASFWMALPVAYALPGSILNIGIYFGALIDGMRGTALSLVCLYLPCFLFLWGVLPQWQYYREKQGIQRLHQGLTCTTLGLNGAMILLILQHCVSVDVSTSICIFLLAIILNYFWDGYTVVIIVVGGVVAYFRRISVECYRVGDPSCPWPFDFWK